MDVNTGDWGMQRLELEGRRELRDMNAGDEWENVKTWHLGGDKRSQKLHY